MIDSRDDPQQNDCTDDSRCQTAKRPDGSQSDERENPSAQNTADDTDDQIDEQPRAAPFDDEIGDPSGRQA